MYNPIDSYFLILSYGFLALSKFIGHVLSKSELQSAVCGCFASERLRYDILMCCMNIYDICVDIIPSLDLTHRVDSEMQKYV